MKKLLLTAGVVAIASAGTAVGITLAVHHPKTKTVIQTKTIEVKDSHPTETQSAKVVDYSAMETAIRSYMINDENMKNYDYGVSQSEPNVEKTFQQFMNDLFGWSDIFDWDIVSKSSFTYQLKTISDDCLDGLFTDANIKNNLFKALPNEFISKFEEIKNSVVGNYYSFQSYFIAMQLIVNQMNIAQVMQYMENIIDSITNYTVSLLVHDMPNFFSAFGYKQPTNATEFVSWFSKFKTENPRELNSSWMKINMVLPRMQVVSSYVHHNALNIKFSNYDDFKNKVLHSDFQELKNVALSIPYFRNLYNNLVLINDTNVESKVTEILLEPHSLQSITGLPADDSEKAKKLYDKWVETFMTYHLHGMENIATTNLMTMLSSGGVMWIPYGIMVDSFSNEDMHLLNTYLTADANIRQRDQLQQSTNGYQRSIYMDNKWNDYFSHIPYARLKEILQRLTLDLGLFFKEILIAQTSQNDPFGDFVKNLTERGDDTTLVLGRGHFNYNQFD